jgi:hypothetical protein
MQVVSINFLRNPGQDGAYATGWLNSNFYILFNPLFACPGQVRALPNSHHPHKSQLRDGRGSSKMHAQAKVIRKKTARIRLE